MEATIEKTAKVLSDYEMGDTSEHDFDGEFPLVREPHDSFECSSSGRGEVVEMMLLNRALRMMQFAGGAKLRVKYC